MVSIIAMVAIMFMIRSEESILDDVGTVDARQQMADAMRAGDVEKFTQAILDLGDPDVAIGNSFSQAELKDAGEACR